jgi:hypothetical protein
MISNGCVSLNGMPVNFVLFVVSQYDKYEEMNFVQDGAPSYLAFPVNSWLDKNFRGWWIGRGGQKE